MSYKKLVGLLIVPTLALVGCEQDDSSSSSKNDTEEVEETSDTKNDSSADDDKASSDDAFKKAAEKTTEEVTPSVGLTVAGTWSQEGYMIEADGQEAVIELAAEPGDEVKDYYVYITEEDGTIIKKFESEEEVSHSVEVSEEAVHYYAGTSEEDLGDVDDKLNPEEDFVRYERLVVKPASEE